MHLTILEVEDSTTDNTACILLSCLDKSGINQFNVDIHW